MNQSMKKLSSIVMIVSLLLLSVVSVPGSGLQLPVLAI